MKPTGWEPFDKFMENMREYVLPEMFSDAYLAGAAGREVSKEEIEEAYNNWWDQ